MTDLMHTLPEIISERRTSDSVELTLFISQNLDFFTGHFPDAPILAGVVQLHWAIDFIKQKLCLDDFEVKDIEVLKFKVVITPEQQLTLTLTQKNAEKFTFSYQSEQGLHASGRILVEAIS